MRSAEEHIKTVGQTVSTGAVAITAVLTAAELASATILVVSTDQPLRFTQGTADPTATLGHPLAANEKYRIDGYANFVNFKAIRTGGADCNVTFSLYG